MTCDRAWRYGLVYGRRRQGLCAALSITPEDVAQESVVAFLETGKIGHRQLVDQLRRAHGRPGFSQRSDVAVRTFAVLDEPIADGIDGCTRAEMLPDDEDQYGPIDDAETARLELGRIYAEEPRMAAMLLLRANGWTLARIAIRFRITESRVSQILSQFALRDASDAAVPHVVAGSLAL